MTRPAALALCAALLLPSTAWGQVQCNTHERVIAHLLKKYDEQTAWTGISSAGGLVEITTAADGGTWTLLVTDSTNTTCVVGSGEGWRWQAPAPPADPEM